MRIGSTGGECMLGVVRRHSHPILLLASGKRINWLRCLIKGLSNIL